MKFQCERCGRCCLEVSPDPDIGNNDINRWLKQQRFDILSKIFPVRYSCEDCNEVWGSQVGEKCPRCQKKGKFVFCWSDPAYRVEFIDKFLGGTRCPFLKKARNRLGYICAIHETKPNTCREFPYLRRDYVTKNERECIEWGCKGYKKWKNINRRKGLV